jgi:hypothetical protein
VTWQFGVCSEADHQTTTYGDKPKRLTVPSGEKEGNPNNVLRVMPPQVSVPVPSNGDIVQLSIVSGSASDGRRDPVVAAPAVIDGRHVTNTTQVTHRAARPILGSAANLNLSGQALTERLTGSPPVSLLPWEQSSSSMPVSKQSPSAGEAGVMLTSLGPLNGPVPASQLSSTTVLSNCADATHCSMVSDQSTAAHLPGVRPPSAGNAHTGWLSEETATLPIAYHYITQSADKPLADTPSSSNSAPVSTVSVNDSSSPGPTLCSNGCCQCGQCPLQNVPPPLPVGNFATYYSPIMFQTGPPYVSAIGYIPSLSFPPPPLGPIPFSSGYTQSADLVYTNPTMFTLVQHQQRPFIQLPRAVPLPPPPRGMIVSPPLGAGSIIHVPFNPSLPPPNHTMNQLGGGNGGKRTNSGGKSLSCYNCGNVGHLASWCPEPKIQSSVAPLGELYISY